MVGRTFGFFSGIFAIPFATSTGTRSKYSSGWGFGTAARLLAMQEH